MRVLEWRVREVPEFVWRELVRRLGVTPLLARVLAARGIRSEQEARDFLSPTLDALHDPFLFRDMEAAVERLFYAVAHEEPILIYGDYDVDGVTAAALTYRFLRHIGANVMVHIPNRLTEGYGVSFERLRRAYEEGVKVVVTVDCGVTSVEEVAWAKERGMDTIITDHHNAGDELPKAVAVIDPKVEWCNYPFEELAGVGVAFKLAWGLGERFGGLRGGGERAQEMMLDALALVALGTVADVVPLVGENRTLVRFGLRALEATRNVGLRALLEITRLDGSQLTARHISFRLAPRLNAAGRLGHSDLPLRLLTSTDTTEAYEVARQLETDNRQRQKVENQILQDVKKQLTPERLSEPVVTLVGNWHAGVVGVVASRLASELNRPVVMVCCEGERAKGTARSVEGFDVYALLSRLRHHLEDFGGHAFAAGFETSVERVEAFVAELREAAHQCAHLPSKTITVDAWVDFADLSVSVVEELGRLEPLGEGNPPPTLASRDVVVMPGMKRSSRDGKNLILFLRQNRLPVRAVMCADGRIEDTLRSIVGKNCDVAYRPRISKASGIATVELEIEDVRMRGRSLIAT